MIKQIKIDQLHKRFRILKNWKIKYHEPNKHDQQRTGIYCNKQKAVIYGWPKREKREPKDFLIHEILHIAANALVWIDRRHHKAWKEMEEEFVQDVCSLIKGK